MSGEQKLAVAMFSMVVGVSVLAMVIYWDLFRACISAGGNMNQSFECVHARR